MSFRFGRPAWLRIPTTRWTVPLVMAATLTAMPARGQDAITMGTPSATGTTSVPVPGAANALSTQRIRVVGGLAITNQYTRHEEKFWSRDLARLSGGRFSASIVPFDRAGVPGPEMLNLMKLGVVPFGTALLSQTATQYPELAAPDLAGLNPDMATLRAVVAAFRPHLETLLRERHGVELLAVYVYPAQVVFCQQPMKRLADLAGRRIRVSSATQSDFIAAFNAIPVVTEFSELMANMESGNTECAVTGTMSGNTLGLHERTRFIHTLPISWGIATFAANRSAWAALNPDLKALLQHQIPRLEATVWAEAESETGEGVACNTGGDACTRGRRGRMSEVRSGPEDEKRRREVFATRVLPGWVQRCGAQCAEVWNRTVAPVVGIRAAALQ